MNDFETLRAENDRIMNTFQKVQAEYRAEVQRLRKKYEEDPNDGHDPYIRDLKAEVERLRAARARAWAKVTPLEAEVERLTFERDQARGEVYRRGAEVERLQEIVRVGFAAQERADYEAIEMLKAEVERLRAANDILRDDIREMSQREERLRGERVQAEETWRMVAREREAEIERLRKHHLEHHDDENRAALAKEKE